MVPTLRFTVPSQREYLGQKVESVNVLLLDNLPSQTPDGRTAPNTFFCT